MKSAWEILDKGIGLRVNGSIMEISAAEIVRVEFKGRKEVGNTQVSERPSAQLPDLRINRFPARLILELEIPSGKARKPVLICIVKAGRFNYTLEEFPKITDQIIVGNQWFPVVQEETQDIVGMLESCGINRLGKLTMRQALDLMVVTDVKDEVLRVLR